MTDERARVPELCTLDDLAKLWGVSAKRLRRFCGARHADPLPCIRLGHTIRFDLTDPSLIAWLERRVQKPSAP